jgi:uncharacterized protein
MKPEEIYIHTAGGNKVYPFAMTPEQVDIQTIARHLACQSRWLGATQHRFLKNRISYSVAEHSVYVSDFVTRELGRPDLAFDALMHDAAEAYIGDMIRPLKYSPAFHDVFKELEDRVERVISRKYGLTHPFPPEVKVADNAVCMAEWEQIVPRNPNERWGADVIKAGTIVKAAPIGIAMLHPYEAYELFMDRFRTLSRHDARQMNFGFHDLNCLKVSA